MKKIIFIVLVTFLSCLPVKAGIIGGGHLSGGAWYSDWGRKVQITIPKTICTSGTATDVPILLYVDGDTPLYAGIPSEAIDAGSNSAQNGGGDLRFYDNTSTDYSQVSTNPATEDTDRLPCEIVNYVTNATEATREAEIWVKVPTVNCNDQGSAITIVMYYNATGKSQPVASGTYGSQNVWRSEFKGVYHLSNLNDSTSNGNTLSVGGGTPDAIDDTGSTCKIGGCYNFDPSYTEWVYTDQSDITGEPLSLVVWTNMDAEASWYTIISIADKDVENDQHYMRYDGTNDKAAAVTDDGTVYYSLASATTATGEWHQWLARYASSSSRIGYMDVGTAGAETTSASVGTLDRWGLATTVDSSRYGYFDGKLDEAWFISSAMDVSIFESVYNNTNDPNTYVVEGTPSGL